MSDRARKLGDYGAGGQTSFDSVASDQEDTGECEDCEQLPDNWVCADCYIKRGKDSEVIK